MPNQADDQDWNRDGAVGPAEGFIGGRQEFARDVLINVLANLVAAAILYVLGVAVGLLPRSGPALFIAFVVMGSLAIAGLVRFQRSRKMGHGLPWLWEAFSLYTAACYALALFCFPDMPWYLRWFCYWGVGVGLLLAADPLLGWIERRIRSRRARRAT